MEQTLPRPGQIVKLRSRTWLENVAGDLEREPARIRDFYRVQSHRIEPVGSSTFGRRRTEKTRG